MRSICYSLVAALAIAIGAGSPAFAQQKEVLEQEVKPQQGPGNLRGKITEWGDGKLVLQTREGDTIRIIVPEQITVIAIEKGRIQSVDFGVYVGSVAKKLAQYSPIVRDSLSWLHKGYEFRIIDEQLRGIALGHQKWDLTTESVMAHGWVDDIEGRVFSIKYGPTEAEETDVEVPRGMQVMTMTLGDTSLIKTGKPIVVGAGKNEDGVYAAQFIFIGKNGANPGL